MSWAILQFSFLLDFLKTTPTLLELLPFVVGSARPQPSHAIRCAWEGWGPCFYCNNNSSGSDHTTTRGRSASAHEIKSDLLRSLVCMLSIAFPFALRRLSWRLESKIDTSISNNAKSELTVICAHCIQYCRAYYILMSMILIS